MLKFVWQFFFGKPTRRALLIYVDIREKEHLQASKIETHIELYRQYFELKLGKDVPMIFLKNTTTDTRVEVINY
jgi:hypothetical protein